MSTDEEPEDIEFMHKVSIEPAFPPDVHARYIELHENGDEVSIEPAFPPDVHLATSELSVSHTSRFQ